MSGKVDHAARRAAKLAAHETALPPEQRIINRTDWDDLIEERVSVLTRQQRENSKRAFIATAVDPAVGICDRTEEAELYFQRGGKPFTSKILRQFLEASAISRAGYIKAIPSVTTIKLLLINLFGAAKAAGNPIERDVRNDALLWLEGSLLVRGLVHAESREKRTPIPEDITVFLRRLFDRNFISTLQTTRDALLIALYVCLQVDCSSRASELLRPNMSRENLAAYNVEHDKKMFTWGCVEVFAFKNEESGQIYLQARLTFRDIKNVQRKGYRKKTIPLRLLPPTLAAEDSLLWLMVLGLIDGVFAGVSSWQDIDRLQPGPNGLLLPIKDSMRQTPVFRTANYPFSSSQDSLISEEQMGTQQMLVHLHRLSRFCGLEYAMLPNVLRRGSAYILAMTVTREERCARMGHTEKDTCYWDSYRNTTSTVDFQALRHGIEQINVSKMSSIFLNTDNAQPPSRVSKEGMRDIYKESQLLTLLEEQSVISDELLLEYGTLEKARSLNPARHRHYLQIREKYTKRLSHLIEKRYKEEYKAYWETRKKMIVEPQQAATPVAGPSEVDLLLDEQDRELDESSVAISPSSLEVENEAAGALSELVSSLQASEAAGDFSDVVQDDQEYRFNEEIAPIVKRAQNRSFITRDISRHSLVDEAQTYLYEQTQDTTWSSLSAYFVTAFNHLHPADYFFPGQEPPAGTYNCRFCGVHFCDIRSEKLKGAYRYHYHAYYCQAARVCQDVLEGLQAHDGAAVSLCPLFQLNKKDGTSLVPCKFKFKPGSWKPFRDHVNSYHRQSGLDESYICLNHGLPLVFSSLQDFRTHVVTAHSAPTSIMNYQRPGGAQALEELIFFCPFCHVFIPRTEQLEEAHLTAHINDAVEVITTRGMAGKFRYFQWVHPGFCPFCVYDATLGLAKRLHQFSTPKQLLMHIAGHLKTLEGSTPCPATALTPEGLPLCFNLTSFNAGGMAAHFKATHGLDVQAHLPAPELDGVRAEKKRKKAATATSTAANNGTDSSDSDYTNVAVREAKTKGRKKQHV